VRSAVVAVLAMAASPLLAREDGSSRHVDAVERGLLPLVRVAGREIRFELSERMAHYRVPGVSVAVLSASRVAWAKGYGVLEAEHRKPVDRDTLFQAASISKPIAALAALREVADGRLSLDAPVNAALQSWKLPDTPHTVGHPVTLRSLLSHTAGLGVHGFPGYGPNESVPLLRDVLDGSALANTPAIRSVQPPGEGFRYSGGGYVILQQLLTDVSGRPFPDLMRERVLDPLGMEHSRFEHPLGQAFVDEAARGHDATGRTIPGGWNTYPELAAAGLWTTAGDLARFVAAVQVASRGSAGSVLPDALAGEMVTPVGGPAGLGLFVEGEGDARRFQHGGSNSGYRCKLVGYLQGGYGAVVMTNGDAGLALAREILYGIADVYGWPGFLPEEKVVTTLEPHLLASYAGRYEMGPHRSLLVTVSEGRLVLEQSGSVPIELWPESTRRFFTETLPLEVRFEYQDDAVIGLTLIRDAEEIQALRAH
jgi:CubicO group peptidase (beta-lactamase class C family)